MFGSRIRYDQRGEHYYRKIIITANVKNMILWLFAINYI